MACAVGFFINVNKINDLGVVFKKTNFFKGAFISSHIHKKRAYYGRQQHRTIISGDHLW